MNLINGVEIKMDKQQIAVVFGGVSTEHEISLISATTIIQHLNQEKYDIHCIGITREGRMLYYTGDVSKISLGTWEQEQTQDCIISSSRIHKGFFVLSEDGYKKLTIDCVIPALHGKNGEDGTIQGLLQLVDIPFVGSDAISCANCMDKEMTHIILQHAKVRMANWSCVRKGEPFEEVCCRLEQQFSYPVFVKPANAGSSIGVSKASDRQSLHTALECAFQYDKKVIVEETLVGKEVECAVLGNEFPKASIAGEISSANVEIYDYDSKYVNPQSQLYIPARISEKTMEILRQTAVKAYQAIGCGGLSRVDFFVTDQEEVILNEINTFPGFTSISMYPKMWEKTGIPIEKLLDELITYGLNR